MKHVNTKDIDDILSKKGIMAKIFENLNGDQNIV